MFDSKQWRSTAAKWAAGMILVVSIPGCVPTLTESKPRDPNTTLPKRFDPVASQNDVAGRAQVPKSNLGQVSWHTFFPNQELRSLVETALANNQELNVELQEVLLAKYEIGAAQGEYLPKVSAGLGAGVDKVGEHTSQGVSDSAHGISNPLPDYRVGFNASWEVDIWSKLRNGAKAARYRYLASVEGRNFVITKLVAEIASSYYELLALDQELAVLRSNIEIQRNALDVVKLQKLAARVTELAVQRFAAEVLKNQSRQYTIEQQIVEAENRINFLVGRFPQHVTRDPKRFDDPMPLEVDTGVPSTLLENRPDVRRAQRELEAMKLDVQVARARFYPTLSIEAGVGYQAFNVQHLLATPESLIGTLAGNLTAPLLNRQAIEADYYSANARQLQAVYDYERTVLQAFTDVVNLLSKVKKLRQTYEFEAQQVNVLTQSITVSNTLFQSARADYMEVLLTRRDALESQMELIETKLRQRHALINVYQALGGGWR